MGLCWLQPPPAAGVLLPTVTITQSAVPWSMLTPWEHFNEVTHAIHAWNALKSMAGTLCPAASAMMRRKAKANTSLWELLRFSLTSVGDFSHGKLQKNVLHLTDNIPVKSNCVALRDPYRQIIQPPRIMFIYFNFFFKSICLVIYASIKTTVTYCRKGKDLLQYLLTLQPHFAPNWNEILCLYWYKEIWQVVSRFIDAA